MEYRGFFLSFYATLNCFNLEDEYEVQVNHIIKRNDEKFNRITQFFRGIKEENMKNIQKNKKKVKENKEIERG